MNSFPITDSSTIKKYIPQREPIIMVDALLAYHDQYIQSALTITATTLFVANNELTEGGIIEHMAQSVALYTGYKYYTNNEQAPVGYIGSISKLEIHFFPAVHQQISTEVQILHDIMGVTLVDTICTCQGRLVAKAQMKTVLAK